ncbi:hypothetical protein B0H16DRAFT_1573476 [Mycena metata]|uniref:Uncharacterized protein n=1 Tax=Mycena metata TaxID=1033252 RepID=A0AAD7MYQ5_9AGAR|nr:hypothetical protein B0H16DRAFT_1573476 [Mycena metata]
MLPNLQSLNWRHGDDDFQYIDCFLAPQLTRILIPHTSLAALRCPQLTAITLFPRGELHLRSLAVSAVSACVRSLHSIERLYADTLDLPALEHLSRLPNLRHLRLGGLPSSFHTHDNEALFSSLKTLCFYSDSESPVRFLEWGHKTPLVDFVAECPAFSTAEEVQRLFSAVAGGISHSSLTEFTFNNEFGALDTSDSASYLIRSSALRSLFCFVNLTSVSVSSAVGIDLDDTTVTDSDMARSWRHIEFLDLHSYYGTPAPRATLQCLEAFPKYCHHLTTLSLAFDATVIPTLQGDLYLESLEKFDAQASPIATVPPVARFIFSIFPSLQNIVTLPESLGGDVAWEGDLRPEVREYNRRWTEVARIYASLQNSG